MPRVTGKAKASCSITADRDTKGTGRTIRDMATDSKFSLMEAHMRENTRITKYKGWESTYGHRGKLMKENGSTILNMGLGPGLTLKVIRMSENGKKAQLQALESSLKHMGPDTKGLSSILSKMEKGHKNLHREISIEVDMSMVSSMGKDSTSGTTAVFIRESSKTD